MLVAALVLFFCSLVSAFILFSLKDTLLANAVNTAEFTKSTIDTVLLEIQKYVFALDLHPVNIRMKKIKNTKERYSEELYTFTNQLQDYKNIHSAIESIYICYPYEDLIIGNLGCFPIQSYCMLENDFFVLHIDEQASFGQSNSGFIAVAADDKSQLYYVKLLYYQGEKTGYIVIKLRTNELLKNITQSISSDVNYKAYGILFDNQLVDYTGSEHIIHAFADGNFLLRKPFSDIFIVSSSFSPNLRYVSFYSYNDIFRPLYVLLSICIISFSVICLAALSLSYFISLKNLKPLNLLLKQIGIDPLAEEDTIKAISQKINNLMNEKNIQMAKLQSRQDTLNGLFLARLIEKPCSSEAEAFLLARQYDIMFEFPFFVVCVMALNEGDRAQYDKDLIRFFKEYDYEAAVICKNNAYVILLNSEQFKTPSFFYTIIKKAADIFPKDIQFAAGIGLCYDTLKDIPASYKEALEALNNSLQVCTDNVFCYNRTETDNDRYDDFQKTLSALKKNETAGMLLAQKAKEIIERDFKDPLFGTYRIAEELNISNSYLSTVFKNTYAIGTVQYITQLRISEAKQLLFTTDSDVKEIALAVGFSSDISFIRVFKKYESTTPGTLRKKK